MRQNVYEFFEAYSKLQTDEARISMLRHVASETVKNVLYLAYNPNIKWNTKFNNQKYRSEEVPRGMSYANLDGELRRLYLFESGNPKSERIQYRKREELLTILLESLEPKEAQIVVGILEKDLKIPNLSYSLLKKAFPETYS